MTACPKWKDQLLDRALGAPACAALQEHLKDCFACSAALTELRSRRERMDECLVRLVQGAEPSAAWRARLVAGFDEVPARKVTWPARSWALTVAAMVIVFAAGIVFSTRWRMGTGEHEKVWISRESLSAWHSPTRSLLHSSADKLLESVPRLGDSYFPLQAKAFGSRRGKKGKG